MKIEIKSSQGIYDIIIERGCLDKLGDYLDLNRKVMVITDSGVPRQYLDTVLSQCNSGYFIIVEQGEGAKSFKVYEDCLKEMLANSFSRKDLVIALGGGVVGDLSGFVAATYMRGVDFVNIPTTTLAQIDSSIGGKVAINVDNLKNCVGAFYQPKLVLIDVEVLSTLSERHYNEGLAEAVKAGLIKDKELFEVFEKEELDIDQIIYKSLLVKKYFVEIDEKELNERQILNFGHTIGHAYESYYGLKEYLHGECVAMGMMAILEEGIIKERLKKVLLKLNLPIECNVEKDKLLAYLKKDKKAYADKISIIKLEEIGKPEIVEMKVDEIERLI